MVLRLLDYRKAASQWMQIKILLPAWRRARIKKIPKTSCSALQIQRMRGVFWIRSNKIKNAIKLNEKMTCNAIGNGLEGREVNRLPHFSQITLRASEGLNDVMKSDES
jgi:hypothetical protein